MRRGDPNSERDRWAWLAPGHCYKCEGLGMKTTQSGCAFHPRMRLCDCVYRAAFRKCYHHYRYLRDCDNLAVWPTLEVRAGLGPAYEFKGIDFMADIESTAARTLPTIEMQVWLHHYLGNRIWRECLPLIGCRRGAFFHACYAVEQRLGKLWLEAGMYPSQYFTAHYIEHLKGRVSPLQARHSIPRREEAA